MSNNNMQPRQPKGVPSGGQWRATVRPEGDVALDKPSQADDNLDERFVEARSVLVRGVKALGPQSEALTLVGAQAVFEHVHGTGLPLTLTGDGDQSVWPHYIDETHDIFAALVAAGFTQYPDRPGIWGYPASNGELIGFDLLVPGSIAGPGRRGARVPGQDKHALGRADGLELSLLNRAKRAVRTFGEPEESVEMYVAGPAAILCAKSYKLAERLVERDRGGRDRVRAKDAGDAWRMMAVSDPREVRRVFEAGERHETMGPAIARGRKYLHDLFGPEGVAVVLAVSDLRRQVGEKRTLRVLNEWMASFSGRT